MGVAITVRDVPDDVRDELAARAARAGKSLQEYLRGMLVASAARPPVDDVIARARAASRRQGCTSTPRPFLPRETLTGVERTGRLRRVGARRPAPRRRLYRTLGCRSAHGCRPRRSEHRCLRDREHHPPPRARGSRQRRPGGSGSRRSATTSTIEQWPYELLATRAWELRRNLSSYDASYVALADLTGATLVTLDARVGRAPGLRCAVATP